MTARRLLVVVLSFAAGFGVCRTLGGRPDPGPLAVGTGIVLHRPGGDAVTGDGGESSLTVTDHRLTVYRVAGGTEHRPPDGVRVWKIDLGGHTYFAAEPRD